MKKPYFHFLLIALSAWLLISGCNRSGGGSGAGAPSGVSGTSAAQVLSLSPADGAINVELSASVEALLSQPLDPQSVTPATFVVFLGFNQVAGTVSVDGGKVLFQPSSPLKSNTHYRATLTQGIKDMEGGTLAQEFSWFFFTKDTTPPTIVLTSPADGAQNVLLDASISVVFSKGMNPTTINPGTFTLTGPLGPIAGAVSYDGQAAVFQPTAPFPPLSSTYTARVTTGIQDTNGNALAGDYVWTFSSIDGVPPVLLSHTPSDGATEISQATTITATFDEAINPASLSTATFKLVDLTNEPGGMVSGGVLYNPATFTASFAPFGTLKSGSLHQATVVGGEFGITDAIGNPLLDNCPSCSWTFTTALAWTPPLQIDNLPGDAQNPHAVIAPPGAPNAGMVFITWQQKLGAETTFSILAYTTHPTLGNQGPVEIEAGTGDAINPRVDVDSNGNAWIVFQKKINGESVYSIQASPYTFGTGWGPEWMLETETGDAINPQIKVSSDNSYTATFQQKLSTTPTVYSVVANRANTGGGWAAGATALESLTIDCSLPQLAVAPNGNVTVVFQSKESASVNSVHATQYRPGIGWDAASTLLETAAGDAQNPQVAATPNNVFMAVFQQKLGSPEVFRIVATSIAPGGSWTAAAPIETDGTGNSKTPSIAGVFDNSFYVSYVKLLAGEFADSVVVNRFVPSLGWAGTPSVIESSPITPSGVPVIAAAGDGSVAVVWEQLVSGFLASIVVNQIPPGGTWSPADLKEIDAAAWVAFKPKIVSTNNNKFLVVWHQFADGEFSNSIWMTQSP